MSLKKPLVYLAGALESLALTANLGEGLKTRNEIKKELRSFGFSVFAPWEHYSYNEDLDSQCGYTIDPDLLVMKHELSILRKTDILIVDLSQNVSSIGTNMEIAIAYEHDIPTLIYAPDMQKLHAWQFNMAAGVFSDADNLVQYILAHYPV